GRTIMAVVLTALVVLAVLAGLPGRMPVAAQPPAPIGPLAQLGIDLRDGFLLYWSEVGNKAGGRPVELILETKASNKPDEGLTKARNLMEHDKWPARQGAVRPLPERGGHGAHLESGTERRRDRESAHRFFPEPDAVLEVESRGLHGDDAVCRAAREMGQVRRER
ncbi:MAG TPA: hypothetical protein VGR43_11360, partial [Dehalococcoidia bacterium]|nr:hypothetical protein [Dehalococcoidia bacterium]